MKRFLVLSAVLSGSAIAASLGTCTPGALSGYIGNACTLGDTVFDNFNYSGNVDSINVNIDFQMAGTEFRVLLAPVTGAGFFTNLSFVERITVLSGVAPNTLPSIYQLVGVKDQSNFSLAANSSGQLVVSNSPGPVFTLVPGAETGGPTFIAPTSSIVTTSTLTSLGGTGSAAPGLSSLELGYIQTDTAIPEPASLALISGGLLFLGLLRNRPRRKL